MTYTHLVQYTFSLALLWLYQSFSQITNKCRPDAHSGDDRALSTAAASPLFQAGLHFFGNALFYAAERDESHTRPVNCLPFRI